VAALVGAVALTLFLGDRIPATGDAERWLFLGGLAATAVTLATWPLARLPRRGAAPVAARPAPVRPRPSVPAARHHAVRLAVALGIAGMVAARAGTASSFAAHSGWLGIGAWIALDPRLDVTLVKGVQRLAGTLAGGALVVAIAALAPAHLWLGWLALALALVAFTLRPVNYAWYCVFLTPVVVLGLGPLDPDPGVLAARLVWTAAGVALALALRLVAWPTHAHAPADGPVPVPA